MTYDLIGQSSAQPSDIALSAEDLRDIEDWKHVTSTPEGQRVFTHILWMLCYMQPVDITLPIDQIKGVVMMQNAAHFIMKNVLDHNPDAYESIIKQLNATNKENSNESDRA